MTWTYKLTSFLNPAMKEADQYYYFVPHLGDGFDTEMLATNWVQNTTAPQGFSDLELVVNRFDSALGWKAIDRIKFGSTGIHRFRTSSYGLNPGEVLMVATTRRQTVLSETSRLPLNFVKKNDPSAVAIRCRLGFAKEGAYSSYQAEYPGRMIASRNGSTLALGHLTSVQEPGTKASMVFVNVSEGAAPDGLLRLIDSVSGKTLMTHPVKSNHASVIPLDPTITGPDTAIIVNGLAGIPIYLNERRGPNGQLHLSCEHAHPPSEYSFNDKIANQIKLKRTWLEKYPHRP